ncbi:MAG: HAMP domain-containing protein [Aquabacterium sp.]|nr:MAG: HAMP domain-containing protein [Aquabacterium sp.]
MKLADIRIGPKLFGAFGIVLAIATVQSIYAVRQLAEVNEKSSEIADNWLPSIRVLGELNHEIAEHRIIMLRYSQSSGDEVRRQAQSAAESAERVAKRRADYEKLISSGQERALYEAFSASWKAYLETEPKLAELVGAGKLADAWALLIGDGYTRYQAATKDVEELVALNNAGGQTASHEADAIYARARISVLAALAVMIASGLAIAWRIAASTSRQLGEASAAAEAVAEGKLDHDIRIVGRDEVGVLLGALKRMQARLSEIVGSVRSGADSVSIAAQEIAQGNADLSGRTEQQASALEQTAASMEQLSSTVKQNADNAREADNLARSATGVAERAGGVVTQVVNQMGGISSSSKKIAEIIGTIDGIAFQTNILALNAAVEAARAGEQGRGFAVVAGEVRSLAQRSANAAKEIKSLITDSVERIDSGYKLADEAGSTMQQVVQSIARVAQIMNEINSASREQSSGIEQVSEAVSQMDQTTQQNAALVEQASAAAESLRTQAAALVATMGFFQTAGHQGFGAPPASHAPAASKASPAKASASRGSEDRRGPNRATNVARITPAAPRAAAALPAPAAAPATATVSGRTGTDDGDWDTF